MNPDKDKKEEAPIIEEEQTANETKKPVPIEPTKEEKAKA